MNAKQLFPLVLFFTITAIAIPAKAQIQMGGLADFELRKAGDDSSPYVNQTPNSNWSVYTPYLRLFFSGDISEKWYVSSVLQADHYHGEALSTPFFSVMNVNWLPIDDSDFTVSAGRFVTPYGAYSERVLSSDNAFVHLPLSHASGLPISKKHGVLFDDVDYGDIIGLTMVYQRMYTQGISIQNQVGDSGWLRYTLAATLASASSHLEYGQHNVPAFTGRIILQPFVWGSLGLSLSQGPFMVRDSVNTAVSDEVFSNFTQTLAGADIQISYHYYTFLVEYNWSHWKTPYFDEAGEMPFEDWSYQADAGHFSTEFVVNFPFLPGAYTGIRYEKLISGNLSVSNDMEYPTEVNWTYDRERIELTAGYKLQRNVILKASYLYSDDTGPGLNDDVFALQLSVGF